MELTVKPESGKPLSIKAWRIETELDPASRITMSWGTKQGFSIGALLSGKLSLNVGEKAGAYIPDVTFKNMYIANYDMVKENAALGSNESDENSENRTAAREHGFYYSIGDWGLSGGDAAKQLLSQHTPTTSYDDLLAYGGHGPSPVAAPLPSALPASDKPLAEAEVGGFKVTLDKVTFIHENQFSHMGFYIKAGGSLLYDQLSASVGLKVWANMDWDTYKLSFDDVKFHDITAKGSFGGSACEIEGTLTCLDEGGESGWQADLKMNVRELFKMTAAGKFSKVKDETHGTYNSFVLSLGLQSEAGIPVGVVSIDALSGGFYYNSKLDMTADYGTCAFALGIGMKTTGTSNLMNGTLDGLIVYNRAKKSLSKIRFDGKVHALCGTNKEKGLINTDVMIEYNNDEKERAFRIQTTMQGGVDEKDLLAQCKQFVGNDSKFQKLCNKLDKVSDMTNDKLNEFGVGSGDSNKTTEKVKDRKGIEGKGEIKASAGLKLSFDFAVVYNKSEKKTKWHVYVGEPSRDKRCTLTLIDFQLGSKSSSVAAWCRVYANAYVCLGNELPNGGAMPDLPEKVQNYLYKTNKNVDANNGTAAQTKQKRQAEFNKITTASGNSPGGVMFGAEAGGEFGINAVLCYARADLVAGFDVAMLFAKDMMCSGGGEAGKHGFYCNGQVYGYAGGQLGLMIKTRLWSGKFPIVDAGIGALMKGGFVNPTWIYGKLKAHCKLLGGLIKFKSTIEVKAGNICLPVAKNPLEDIKIFGGSDPGYETSAEGWEESNAVSVFTRLNFSTNMPIGADLRLLDENISIQQAGLSGDASDFAQNAERIFRFEIDNTMPLYIHRKSGSSFNKSGALVGNYNHQSIAGKNNEEFYLKVGPAVLEPEQGYHVELTGHGYEMVNGVKKNPLSLDQTKMQKGIREEWKDTYTFYFRTGELSTNLTDYVQFSFPENKATQAPMDEARGPVLVLKRDVSSFMNNSNYEYLVELQQWDDNLKDYKRVEPNKRTDLGGPVLTYHADKPYYYIDLRWSKRPDLQYSYNKITAKSKYRYVFYRYRKADMDEAANKLKETYKKTVIAAPTGNYDAAGNKVNNSSKTVSTNSQQDSEYQSIADAIAQYNKEFDEEVGSEDNRETRINEMVRRKIKKEAYMDQIYAIEFTANANTLAEMVKNNDTKGLPQQRRLYMQFIDQEGPEDLKPMSAGDYYSGKRPQASYTGYDERTIYNNPYHYLNYMANYVFLHGVTLKQGRLYPYDITSAQGLGLKFNNIDLRGGIVKSGDGSWHGTLFERNLNVRRMMLGDQLYEAGIPQTTNGYFTGPVDTKRRIPFKAETRSEYKNNATPLFGAVYYSTIQDDAILAWRVGREVKRWAEIYRQYWEQKSGAEELGKWVKLLQGTISSGVKGTYTDNGNTYNWATLKSDHVVGKNGMQSTASALIPTLQFPAMQGLWNQCMNENGWKDGTSYHKNSVITLSSLTTAEGYESRGEKLAWEVINRWTCVFQGGNKPISYKNHSEFDWKAYLRSIKQFRYAIYKTNAYNTTTGEEELTKAYGKFPVITVKNPFLSSSGWTMPNITY